MITPVSQCSFHLNPLDPQPRQPVPHPCNHMCLQFHPLNLYSPQLMLTFTSTSSANEQGERNRAWPAGGPALATTRIAKTFRRAEWSEVKETQVKNLTLLQQLPHLMVVHQAITSHIAASSRRRRSTQQPLHCGDLSILAATPPACEKETSNFCRPVNKATTSLAVWGGR